MNQIENIIKINTSEGLNGSFLITLDSPAPKGGFILNYSLTGTAELNSDYVLNAGENVSNLTATSLTVAEGAKQVTLNLSAISDNLVEHKETVNLNVSIPTVNFASAKTYDMGIGAYALALSDLNNDGKQDVITADFYGSSVSVRLGNGDGSFANATQYSVGDTPANIVVTDINKDNKLDVIAVNIGSNSISILQGNGDGSLLPQTSFTIGNAPTALGIIDLNHDNNLDIITANNGDNNFSVSLGNSDGSFTSPMNYASEGSVYLSDLVLTDLNADGEIDLIKTNQLNQGGSVSVFLGKGDGTFGSERSYLAGVGPMGLSLTDINGDNKADMLVSNHWSNSIMVFLSNGDGTFTKGNTYFTDHPTHQMSVIDINNDTKQDVIVANPLTNTLSVFQGKGNGDFHAAQTFAVNTVGWSPSATVITDLNADSKLDVVTANAGGSNISVFLNTTQADLKPQTVSKTLSITDMTGITVEGSSDSNLLNASPRNDILNGMSGDDTLNGFAGSDTLNGGENNDILNGGIGDDILNGEAGFDKLNGGIGNDIINGGNGNDLLVGGVGNDVLNGDSGIDTLVGGAGSDTFKLSNIYDADSIRDFVSGTDEIQLNKSLFNSLTGGTLGADNLQIANVNNALNDSSFLIYNNTTGVLYYDNDANGTDAAPFKIAVLAGHPLLNSNDFTLI